jgi:hypothetical protein
MEALPGRISPVDAGVAAVPSTACAIPGAATAITSMAMMPRINASVDVKPGEKMFFITTSNMNCFNNNITTNYIR